MFSFFYLMKYLPLKGWRVELIIFLDQSEGLGSAMAPITGRMARNEPPALSDQVSSQPAVYGNLLQNCKMAINKLREFYVNPTINKKNRKA